MSELVKKVQDAILEAYDFDGIATEKMSRAAIAAVAEWLDEQGFDSADNLAIDLVAELKRALK